MKKISKRDITILAIDFLNEKRFEVLSSLTKELKSLEGVKVINRDGNKSKKFTLKSIHDEMILNDIYYTFSAWYDLNNYVKLRTRVRINGGSNSDNSAFTEYCFMDHPLNELLFDNSKLEILNGYVEKPKTYGLGVKFNEKIIQKYSYREKINTMISTQEADIQLV